jgi:metal-responsive CopG/Arc/MetJ family transcriptional regulator
MKAENAFFVRASISFPADIYQSLGNLAKRKKVSLAWVVREAAERYVADEMAKGRERPNQTVRAGKLTRKTE